MLALVYFNVGKQKAFKKAITKLSSKLIENGYSCSVCFDDFRVENIYPDYVKFRKSV